MRPDRGAVQAALTDKGIPTAVYYPIPLSRQNGYAAYPSAPTPVSDTISKTVLSLPMHAYLESTIQDRVIREVITAVG